MNIKSDKVYMNADFIYSYSVYSGWLEGKPSLEENKRTLKHIEHKALELIHGRDDIPLYIDTKDPITELLPGRGNIAWLDDGDRHVIFMWFDRGDVPAETALVNFIANSSWPKKWKSISKEFMW